MKTKQLPGQQAYEAALEYTKRKARVSHPDGWFDKAKRWYPSAAEDCGITSTIRTPSRGWPYSYLLAARSLQHVATLYGQEASMVRAAVKDLNQRFGTDQGFDFDAADTFVEQGGPLFCAVSQAYALAPAAATRKL